MSSRALRKLQREQELQKQDSQESQEYESEEEEIPPKKLLNAFDMLDQAEADGENESDAEQSTINKAAGDEEANTEQGDVPALSKKPKVNAKAKSKKKKNRKKAKNENVAESAPEAQASDYGPALDEIDIALRSLSKKTSDIPSTSARVQIDEANLQMYRLLAVESKHLNALTEMKRLFGNVVLENEDEPAAAAQRRRGRGPQQLDLGGALAGRNSPGSRGQGLAGLALRRNPFIVGKEEWPKATSGGLGMELVEKMEDETVEYRFVHNSIYQDVQRQFQTCVASMDPQRMISLLQYNPYHISTLLQVSEIAKQQGDHSVSGDLLERALFSFGRSVHSSFTTALGEGKARLDFRRPENREFWLAAWRYTINLGQRGTWRTAYEWAKLILSLDPEGDPYCMVLLLDQLAIRGGQSEHFLQMSQTPFFHEYLWKYCPNVRISSALAEYKLKQPQASRASLMDCINDYPWVFARLFQSLNIDHIPKSVWGKSAQSERDNFFCESYVHNAKDLWNTPEAISFLVEVAESMDATTEKPPNRDPLTLDEARHVLLSGVPSLVNLIPREFTTMSSSSSDPLPPPDDLPSYSAASLSHTHLEYEPAFVAADDTDTDTLPEDGTPNPRSPEDNEREVGEAQELSGIQGFLRRLIPWVSGQAPEIPPDEEIERRAAEIGIPPEAIAGRAARLRELRELERISRGENAESADDPADSSSLAYSSTEEARTEEAERRAEDPSIPGTYPRVTEVYDDDRNQRWLAGQGMLRLRDFTNQHGTHESSWSANSGQEIVTEYARRALQLAQQRTRNFILDYTLKQGTSQDVKDLIDREIERVQNRN
ncbi:transcription factor 25, partial [Lecanoromycetidae sp. Uapishka_2]